MPLLFLLPMPIECSSTWQWFPYMCLIGFWRSTMTSLRNPLRRWSDSFMGQFKSTYRIMDYTELRVHCPRRQVRHKLLFSAYMAGRKLPLRIRLIVDLHRLVILCSFSTLHLHNYQASRWRRSRWSNSLAVTCLWREYSWQHHVSQDELYRILCVPSWTSNGW